MCGLRGFKAVPVNFAGLCNHHKGLRVNTLGGAVLGLLEGMMVVWLLIWLAPRLGIALPAENTYLLHFFMTVGPMGLLSSLS